MPDSSVRANNSGKVDEIPLQDLMFGADNSLPPVKTRDHWSTEHSWQITPSGWQDNSDEDSVHGTKHTMGVGGGEEGARRSEEKSM